MPNDNDAMSQKGPRPSDAKRIERHAFDTASLSEAEALQQFQHLVMAPGWIEPQSLPLAVRVVTYWLADSRLRVFESTPYRVTRSAEKIASDRLDHIIVTYVIEGSVRGDCDGRTFEAPPGAVYLHDFSRPTWVEGVPDARVKLYRYAMFGLTRPIASRWFGTLAALHGAVLLSEQAPELSQWMRSLVARVETMTVAEAPRELDATMERLAFALAPQIAGTLPAESSQALLEHARPLIEQHLMSRDLNPTFVERELQVSRSQLYRAFQSLGGVSRYIATRRLASIHAALLSPNERRSIAALAHDYGFVSPVHMSRMFREIYGHSPRAIRARGRQPT